MSSEGVIGKFVECALHGNPIEINGDGLNTRDFIYVQDVCGAIILVLERKDMNGPYNVGTGIETSILDLAYMTRDASESKSEIIFKPELKGDIKKSVASTTRMDKVGFKPKYNLKDSIKYIMQ